MMNIYAQTFMTAARSESQPPRPATPAKTPALNHLLWPVLRRRALRRLEG